MKLLPHFAALAALSFSFDSSVQAAVLAEYNFDSSSLASGDASTDWETTVISAGSGVPMTIVTGTVNTANGGDEPGGNPVPAIGLTFADFDYANLGVSLANNGYYSFTITPNAGKELSFTSLSFDIYKTSGAGATISATLFSSIDGFASTGDAIGSGKLVGTTESDAFFSRSIPLSGLSPVTAATEFRLYLDDGGAGNNANLFRLDNIELTGDASSIPEPSSAVLMGIGALGLIARRRR